MNSLVWNIWLFYKQISFQRICNICEYKSIYEEYITIIASSDWLILMLSISYSKVIYFRKVCPLHHTIHWKFIVSIDYKKHFHFKNASCWGELVEQNHFQQLITIILGELGSPIPPYFWGNVVPPYPPPLS